MRLWDAGGAPVDELVLAFTVGDDPDLDRALVPFDCLASAAHARMLAQVGLLPAEDLAPLLGALAEARRLARAGDFPITREQEDGHTALEAFLVARCGDAGRRIHAGRSRNDQVIAALRLLVRQALLDTADQALALAQGLLGRADTLRTTPMPGYTHTRGAMPSTVGLLLASAAEGLLADVEALVPALDLASRGALGAASGYGVPLPLDREAPARDLGLAGVDVCPPFVQNTRGRLEAAALFGLHQIALTLGRLAADLVWFSSEAFGFFRLPEALTTGSSIMPNKRNPDVLELIRALPASLLGRYTAVTALLHGLPTGYHRDLQRSKGPLLEGLAEVRAALAAMSLAVARLEVVPAACRAAITPDLLATDAALALVREGVPFRDAYGRAKRGQAPLPDLDQALAARTHLGAPGSDVVTPVRARLDQTRARLLPYKEGARAADALLPV